MNPAIVSAVYYTEIQYIIQNCIFGKWGRETLRCRVFSALTSTASTIRGCQMEPCSPISWYPGPHCRIHHCFYHFTTQFPCNTHNFDNPLITKPTLFIVSTYWILATPHSQQTHWFNEANPFHNQNWPTCLNRASLRLPSHWLWAAPFQANQVICSFVVLQFCISISLVLGLGKPLSQPGDLRCKQKDKIVAWCVFRTYHTPTLWANWCILTCTSFENIPKFIHITLITASISVLSISMA